MSARDWTTMIAGDRMAVDREFDERLGESPFSTQEWGLLMSAVEFEIEHPEDDERARLVANTEKLPAVMPEVEKIGERTGSATTGSSSGSGIVDSIKSALGAGGDDRLDDAEALTAAYADELQAHLEANGKWERVRNAASAETD